MAKTLISCLNLFSKPLILQFLKNVTGYVTAAAAQRIWSCALLRYKGVIPKRICLAAARLFQSDYHCAGEPLCNGDVAGFYSLIVLYKASIHVHDDGLGSS